MCVTTPLSATKILKDKSSATITRTVPTMTQGLTHVHNAGVTTTTTTTMTTPGNNRDLGRPQHTSIILTLPRNAERRHYTREGGVRATKCLVN
ncbi:hypothetical protein KQX54_020778 [Cotesia glomerata]|uniref:Uncharacterized protein n=1 Tax=Cotesia glomerata TaxID=32391 RepID=A0AAV7I0E7_COTGL|nr:hypothetical protein KQX54_020778 [Cotesia glomerata]